MAPCTDAVSLVNHEPRQSLAANQASDNVLDLPSHSEHLGRHVDDLGNRFRSRQLLVRHALVGHSQVASIGDSWNATLDEMASLVVDEGNER